MMESYKFVVYSYRGGAGGYDHGSWTGHMTKEDAKDCASRVGGYVYKVKLKGNGSFLMEHMNSQKETN